MTPKKIQNMQHNRYNSSLFLCRIGIIVLMMLGLVEQIHAQKNIEEPTDTAEVEDNPFAIKKDGSVVPIDSAKLRGDTDYRRFVMDTRYMAYGDTLAMKKWYSGLFLQAGMGGEDFVKTGKGEELQPQTTFFGAIGKQLNKYHSLRLRGQGAIGYTKKSEHLYLRASAIADHLFNLTDYLSGYNPARPLGISTVLGLGVNYAAMNNVGKKGLSYDVHAGVQLQFYTGPHGTVNVEPYVMLASDNIDLNPNNWRRFDIGYGVNLNMTYYIENHLSRAARLRYIQKARDGEVSADSAHLYSWQHPWIFELAAGPAVLRNPEMDLKETLGHEVAASVGKWVSPVVGLRASAVMRHTDWAMTLTQGNNVTHTQYFSSLYTGVRVEGMVNPLGFLRSFRWNAPVGAYLVAGAGVGWLIKHQTTQALHCYSESYSAGLHLWARLGDGLQFFVEPRFNYNVYNIPYSNKNWQANFSDETYGVNIGFTAMNVNKPYRRKVQTSGDDDQWHHWTVSLGGGSNLVPDLSRMKGKSKLPFNGLVAVNYNFTRASSARLSMEFVSHSFNLLSNYYDLNMDLPQYNYAPVERRGLWNGTFRLGLASLAYELNMSNAFSGYRANRLFSLSFFLGPGVGWHIGQDMTIDENEPIFVNHEVVPRGKNAKGTYFVVNGGAVLSARVSSHIAISLTPQLHYVPKLDIPGVELSRLKTIETLDLGVQYKF